MASPLPDPKSIEPTPPEPAAPPSPRCSRGTKVFVGSVLTLGLLLWARLIVLSDMPRTAIADEDPPVPASDKSADTAPTGGGAVIPSADPPHDRETGFGKSVINAEFGSEADKSLIELAEDPE